MSDMQALRQVKAGQSVARVSKVLCTEFEEERKSAIPALALANIYLGRQRLMVQVRS